jgi:FlhB-like protein
MDKKKVATALKYNTDEQVAPKLVAKGKGLVAENIIKKAEEAGVRTYEDEHLSQQLYNLTIGDTIPEELYYVVAKVLAFVAELDQSENKFS